MAMGQWLNISRVTPVLDDTIDGRRTRDAVGTSIVSMDMHCFRLGGGPYLFMRSCVGNS